MIPRMVVSSLMLFGVLAPAHAQLGEAHLGAIGSFADGNGFQTGVGVTASYAPGRVMYAGARWIYYMGSTERRRDSAGIWDVTTQAQLFGADLGLEFPLGNMELVTGFTLGGIRFRQSSEPADGALEMPRRLDTGTEFFVAPMAMVEIRVSKFKIVPELSYYFSGSPDLDWPVVSSGFATSLLVVIPIETNRIRY